MYKKTKITDFCDAIKKKGPANFLHMITGPEVEGYAKDKKIALYYSYDF